MVSEIECYGILTQVAESFLTKPSFNQTSKRQTKNLELKK